MNPNDITTDTQRFKACAGMLLFVIQGLRNKSIKSKPILDTSDPEAESYGITTLEDEIWNTLNQCGIEEKKAEDAK